jgi:hypothetical protein
MEKLVGEIEERLDAVVAANNINVFQSGNNSNSGIAGRLLELGELFRITESGHQGWHGAQGCSVRMGHVITWVLWVPDIINTRA